MPSQVLGFCDSVHAPIAGLEIESDRQCSPHESALAPTEGQGKEDDPLRLLALVEKLSEPYAPFQTNASRRTANTGTR